MSLILSEEAIKNNSSSIEEVLTLLMLHYNVDYELTKEKLIDKQLITRNTGADTLTYEGYFLTYKAYELIESMRAESVVVNSKRDLETLAKELKNVFPKGTKYGTNSPWTEGVSLIVKRLKRFISKYDNKEHYSNEDIIDAAKRYVESFNGDYSYMRTLKYFIWAEKCNRAGEVESTSDLLTYLENKGEENVERDIGNILI